MLTKKRYFNNIFKVEGFLQSLNTCALEFKVDGMNVFLLNEQQQGDQRRRQQQLQQQQVQQRK